MPELPEVETIVRGLREKVTKRKIMDVWTDTPKILKKPKGVDNFKKEVVGEEIKDVRRRGKNILFSLSSGKTMLIHQKMTGHLLVGHWEFKNNRFVGKEIPLQEKVNNYIRVMFTFDNGLMMGLSDLRKFAKVELYKKEELEKSKEFISLGIEPLSLSFTLEKFKELLKTKKRGKVKQVLMDQAFIAGIGNIYADEILWDSNVHPLCDISKLKTAEIKKLFDSIKKILEKGVELRGESISDYRDIEGNKGLYDDYRKIYRREGEKCRRCSAVIKRIKIGGRSSCFCPYCQKSC